MERLTVKRQDGRWALANNDGVSNLEQLEKLPRAIDRLAAYEDTGLEPEEVRAQKGLFDYIAPDCGLSDGVRRFQHFRELVQAEQDGRLVVLHSPRLPLIWGDDNHDTILCPNCKHDLMGGFLMEGSYETHMYQCPYCGQLIDETKTLTPEEAEAALVAKEEHDG